MRGNAIATQPTETPTQHKSQPIQLCSACGHDVELHSPVTGQCVVLRRVWQGQAMYRAACGCGEGAGCR